MKGMIVKLLRVNLAATMISLRISYLSAIARYSRNNGISKEKGMINIENSFILNLKEKPTEKNDLPNLLIKGPIKHAKGKEVKLDKILLNIGS